MIVRAQEGRAPHHPLPGSAPAKQLYNQSRKLLFAHCYDGTLG